MKLSSAQIEYFNAEAKKEEPIEVEEDKEEETGSVLADLGRVFVDTASSVGELPVRVGSMISEAVGGKKVPEWAYDESRKIAVDLWTTPLKLLGGDTADRVKNALLDKEGKPRKTETTVGAVAEVIPYVIGGSQIFKAITKKVPDIVKGITSGIAVDQVLYNPKDDNIFNVIQEFAPESSVADYTAFMQAKEDDSELEARIKLIGEGASLGAIIDIAGGAVKLTKYTASKFRKPFSEMTTEEQGEAMLHFTKKSKETVDLRQAEDVVEYKETPEGVAQIALQQSSAPRRFINRFLKTRGYWTKKAYNAFEDSQYAERQDIAEVEHIARSLQKSLDNIVESSNDSKIFVEVKRGTTTYQRELTRREQVVEKVNEALTTDLSDLRGKTDKEQLFDVVEKFNLPQDVAVEVLNARNLIDKMSRNLKGSSAISDALKETIVENSGSYLRRSYRLFEDNGWSPTPEVIKDAENYIMDNLLKTKVDISEQTAREMATDQVDQILKAGERKEAAEYFSSVRKVNKEILKGKEDISEPIRALMGEIKEPTESVVLTVQKMTKLYNTNRFYANLQQLGHSGEYIYKSGDVRNRSIYNAEITGTNSILDGQFTTPEILAELQNKVGSFGLGQGNSSGAKIYRNFLSLKGQSQKNKTVYSHVTHLRNIGGGAQFGPANGINPFGGDATKTLKVLQNSIVNGGDKELNSLYRKYLRLGIVNTSVKLNEFRALLDAGSASNVDEWGEAFAKKAESYGLSKTKQEVIENFYQATDDFYKVNYYNQELTYLKDAMPNIDLDVLEEMAADTVRNTMPNYDRVPKGIKALKELPIGSFVAFPSEIIRTSAHIIALGVKESVNANPKIAARGRRRLAGYTVQAGAWKGVAAGTAALAGFSEDEAEAVHVLSETPWSKESPRNIVRSGGKIYTNDTQFIDSYSPVKDLYRAPLAAWERGEINEEALHEKLLGATGAALFTLLKPYVDEAILTSAITDITFAAISESGRTPEGKEMFVAGLPVAEKAGNMVEHVIKSVAPGSFTSLYSLGEAAFEVPNKSTGKPKSWVTELTTNLSGIKFKELDIDIGLKYAVADYNSSIRNTVTVSPDFKKSGSDLNQRYNQRQEKLKDLQVELYRKVQAAETLTSTREVNRVLKKHKVPQTLRRGLLRNKFKPDKPSSSLFDKILEKTPLKNDQSVKDIKRSFNKSYLDFNNTPLIRPVELEEETETKLLKKAVGGEVSSPVPNAPAEPDERINKLTGLPYNESAGTAYMDQDDPMRVLNMAAGGRVKRSGGGKIAKLIAEPLAKIIKKYSKGAVSDEVAEEAANKILRNFEGSDDMPSLLDDPDMEDYIKLETKALLEEKHDLTTAQLQEQFPDVIERAGGIGGEEFSKVRGYTADERETFEAASSYDDLLGDTSDVRAEIQYTLDELNLTQKNTGGRVTKNKGGKVLNQLRRNCNK